MATPGQKQSQGNKHPSYAAHAVHTPTTHHFGTPTSNTPRSYPSPAVARSGAKGSTTTTPQTAHVGGKHPTPLQSGGGGGGAVPMQPSLSQMSNTSTNSAGGLGLGLLGASPSGVNMLAFASPAALAGLDMSTPSALVGLGEHGTGLSGVSMGSVGGSQPMNLSLSDLGFGRRVNEDEERKAKLGAVLGKLLGRTREGTVVGGGETRFGRVGEEGVRRVGRWAGFDVEVESKWQGAEFEGRRPVAIAGKNAVLIDFSFRDNVPTSIEVSFFSEDKAVTDHQKAASKVLLGDLTPPPGIAAINTKLDRFAANLETLARLDKLSIAGQLNCFEAITGIYTSLRKLYEHEKSAARSILDAKAKAGAANSRVKAEREVMCKKSGRPRMHARRKIGLSLDYWMEQRCVMPRGGRTGGSGNKTKRGEAADADADAMVVDGDDTAADKEEEDDEDDETNNKLYSLDITAEASDPTLYPSLRLSSAWLSERVKVPAAESTSPSALFSNTDSIDWQDPPPTYLPSDSSSTADAMALDGNTTDQQQQQQQAQKLPSARFLAKLNPPIVMPWTVASQVLQTVAAQPSTEDALALRTYDAALLRRARSPAQALASDGTVGGTNAVARSTTRVLGRSNTRASASASGATAAAVDRKADDNEIPHTLRTHNNSLFVPRQDYGYTLREIPFAHPRQLVQLLPVLRQWAAVGALLRGVFVRADVSEGDSPLAAREQGGRTAVPSSQESKKVSLEELLTPPSTPGATDKQKSPGNEDVDVHMDMDMDTNPAIPTSSATTENATVLPIDFTLSTSTHTSSTPTLALVFPLRTAPAGLASVSVTVAADGEILVAGMNLGGALGRNGVNGHGAGEGDDGTLEQNVQSEGAGGGNKAVGVTAADAHVGGEGLGQGDVQVQNTQRGNDSGNDSAVETETAARALDVAGDVGVWIEWLRGRYEV